MKLAIVILLVLPFAVLGSGMIEGKYTLAYQKNFEKYLEAMGVGPMKRQALASLRPDIMVSIEGGDTVTVMTMTSLGTWVDRFKLGKEYMADDGTDVRKKYFTVLENGDTLVTREVARPGNFVTRKFSDTGMAVFMKYGDVTAVRTFKRV